MALFGRRLSPGVPAQELCILLETYWERNNLTVPIYFSTGLTEKVRAVLALRGEGWCTAQHLEFKLLPRQMFLMCHLVFGG